MATFESVFPVQYLERSPVHIEPGYDITLDVDQSGAFDDDETRPGPLATTGAKEAAIVSYGLNGRFSSENCYAVIDAHVPGSAHSELAYTAAAEIVPNQITLTEERICHWMKIGEQEILVPGAQFSLQQLITTARLTRMFTGRDQVVWAAHAGMGSWQTNLIAPLVPELYCNVFYKGTHPLHDSHSGVWDAVGNPVGTMHVIAARRKRVRKILVKGNAFDVCIYLTLRHLARMAVYDPEMEIYCVVDATGFLPFISQDVRIALIEELIALGVKFVHSSQLVFN